jgi:geranylgeranyl diphosphate synthase, type II
MFDLAAYLKQKRDAVNHALRRMIEQDGPEARRRIKEAMHYSLEAGGKRLRPILCIAAYEAVSGNSTDNIMNVACAIEMIHTYSLIHDDLPAMDNDDLRRGKPTCHIAFDEATAILAGDALLTLAFERLASHDGSDIASAAALKLKIIHLIAAASGCNGMVEGQMRDIESEGRVLDLDALTRIHELKTGALIRASILAGALMGNGTPRELEALEIYARDIGLAFQVADDILDVEGDPRDTGKPTGSDQALNKATFPALIGLEESRAFATRLVDRALHAVLIFDNRGDPLRAIARYTVTRNK